MVDSTFKEMVLREIESLPEARQSDVLAFIRFLKIGLAEPSLVERNFNKALEQARAVASERGISDEDIEGEIRAVRAGDS